MARGDHKAFTLLEVLVASTILGIGILGVLGAFSISMRASSRAMRLDEAVTIAQREMELTTSAGMAAMGPRKGNQDIFQWTVDLADRPDGLTMAAVSVTWPQRGQMQQYRLAEIFSVPQEPEDSEE